MTEQLSMHALISTYFRYRFLYAKITINYLCTLFHYIFMSAYDLSSILPSTCFPGGSDGKASACIAGDLGLIPGSGRSPGEGNGNPLQYSCLENSMDKGAWQATIHETAKDSDIT